MIIKLYQSDYLSGYLVKVQFFNYAYNFTDIKAQQSPFYDLDGDWQYAFQISERTTGFL